MMNTNPSHKTADGLVLFLLASQLLFEQTGASPGAAFANAILGLQVSLQHTGYAATIGAVPASVAATISAIRNALIRNVPDGKRGDQ